MPVPTFSERTRRLRAIAGGKRPRSPKRRPRGRWARRFLLGRPITAWTVIGAVALAVGWGMTGGLDDVFPGSASEIVGTARVLDGDTLDVGGVRVRMHGIDAPESRQLCQGGPDILLRCGDVATVELRRLVGGSPVRCRVRDTDRYGRTVATCHAAGTDLGAAMVSAGYARAHLRYSWAYAPHEARARFEGRGLWQTEWQAPWDYRAQR